MTAAPYDFRARFAESHDLSLLLARARLLYQQILRAGELPADRELARSPAYREFLMLGLRIRAALSAEAFRRMVDGFAGNPDEPRAKTRRHLDHLWAGLADQWSSV